ncbi:hypothetical protein B0H15DRAFT_803443 [Mycena belliarum]|uniref:Uncharacterized protein n=1 Tax=Mycena belliarum TaxID=1033014 RepID=A0AAD6TWS4_9AGAR|nr:hypothetical protein B0H15DRAFT_803443 [Mycena belliae]
MSKNIPHVTAPGNSGSQWSVRLQVNYSEPYEWSAPKVELGVEGTPVNMAAALNPAAGAPSARITLGVPDHASGPQAISLLASSLHRLKRMASSTTKSPPPTTDALPPSPKRFARLRPHAKPRPLDCLFAPPTLDVDARRPQTRRHVPPRALRSQLPTWRHQRRSGHRRRCPTDAAARTLVTALPHPQRRQRIRGSGHACGSASRGAPVAPEAASIAARPLSRTTCNALRLSQGASLPSAHRARLRTPRAADVADPDPDSTVAAHGGDDRRPSTRASRHRRHFAAPTYAPRRPFPTSQRAPPATPRFGVHARLLVVMWRPQVPRNARKSATAQAPRSSTIPAHLAARCEFAARKYRRAPEFYRLHNLTWNASSAQVSLWADYCDTERARLCPRAPSIQKDRNHGTFPNKTVTLSMIGFNSASYWVCDVSQTYDPIRRIDENTAALHFKLKPSAATTRTREFERAGDVSLSAPPLGSAPQAAAAPRANAAANCVSHPFNQRQTASNPTPNTAARAAHPDVRHAARTRTSLARLSGRREVKWRAARPTCQVSALGIHSQALSAFYASPFVDHNVRA